MKYTEITRESRNHSNRVEAYLEQRLPVQAIAHLTTPRPMTFVVMDTLVKRWLSILQKFHRATIAWVRGDETKPRRHVHVVLISERMINCTFAAECWRNLVSLKSITCARVEPYQPERGGLAYTLKCLDVPGCEVRFSQNLALFGIKRLHGRSTSRERRQLHRIQQMRG